MNVIHARNFGQSLYHEKAHEIVMENALNHIYSLLMYNEEVSIRQPVANLLPSFV